MIGRYDLEWKIKMIKSWIQFKNVYCYKQNSTCSIITNNKYTSLWQWELTPIGVYVLIVSILHIWAIQGNEVNKKRKYKDTTNEQTPNNRKKKRKKTEWVLSTVQNYSSPESQ